VDTSTISTENAFDIYQTHAKHTEFFNPQPLKKHILTYMLVIQSQRIMAYSENKTSSKRFKHKLSYCRKD